MSLDEPISFLPRSAWTYLKRLWRFGLLERRSLGKGTLEYRISRVGRNAFAGFVRAEADPNKALLRDLTRKQIRLLPASPPNDQSWVRRAVPQQAERKVPRRTRKSVGEDGYLCA
jgi:hypothetical protein